MEANFFALSINKNNKILLNLKPFKFDFFKNILCNITTKFSIIPHKKAYIGLKYSSFIRIYHK